MEMKTTIGFYDLLKVDIRALTVIRADAFPEARKSEIKLWIDFGLEIGEQESLPHIARHYSPISVIGRQLAAVVNFPLRQISKLMSKILALGFPGDDGEIVVTAMDQPVANGARLY